jgi:hypothetical protein
MSAANVVKCQCCHEDVEEEKTSQDADVGIVCPACKEPLKWAQAILRRRTPQGVSILGMHREGEKPIRWDPSIAEAEYQKWLKSQGE